MRRDGELKNAEKNLKQEQKEIEKMKEIEEEIRSEKTPTEETSVEETPAEETPVEEGNIRRGNICRGKFNS